METSYFVSTHCEASGRTTPTCIDMIRPDGLSMYNGHSLEEISKNYSNVKIMTQTEFQTLQELTECTEPVEITEEKFTEMLCVLPPMRWNNRGSSETFMMCEFKTGRITGIYCRIGESYYSFLGVCTLNHDEIVNKCLDSRGKTGVSNG